MKNIEKIAYEREFQKKEVLVKLQFRHLNRIAKDFNAAKTLVDRIIFLDAIQGEASQIAKNAELSRKYFVKKLKEEEYDDNRK